ncbi:MAG: c-type cytochrome biogenesis protein CcmF, partial [Alphaproteobacteria bacterium]|nr:c-type cytochrome biogenesis protein CcmF [Alphaproteobacteria bacterium]
TFTVRRDGEIYTVLEPEKRSYIVQRRETTEAAIHTTFMKDLYVVLGDEADGAWVTRIYYNPLVPWMWMGSLIMVLGGTLSLSDRRLRVGAPKRHAAPAVAQLAGAE